MLFFCVGMYPLIALSLVCLTLLVELGTLSVWNDSGYTKCMGVPQINSTDAMNEQAMIWIDEVLKGQIYDLFNNPKQSIVDSIMKLANSWECILENTNITTSLPPPPK